mgnify:CR=1 FL=1
MPKNKLEARIRYVENWHNEGEHYLFETRFPNEEWGLDKAFKLFDYEWENSGTGKKQVEKGVLLSYTALTQIREYIRLGIPFNFC